MVSMPERVLRSSVVVVGAFVWVFRVMDEAGRAAKTSCNGSGL